jgi:hypothetical protein
MEEAQIFTYYKIRKEMEVIYMFTIQPTYSLRSASEYIGYY